MTHVRWLSFVSRGMHMETLVGISQDHTEAQPAPVGNCNIPSMASHNSDLIEIVRLARHEK